MEWKYKIPLKSEKVFDEIEKYCLLKIPDEIKELIREANGATPDKIHFMVATNEKIFGAVLSFNRDKENVDSVYTALEVIEQENVLPFAIDPFGNYICIDVEDGCILFFEHVSGEFISLEMDLYEFMETLY